MTTDASGRSRTTSAETRIDAEAVDWVVRTRSPDFAAWDDLSAWLNADPRNVERYEEASLRDAEAADIVRDRPMAAPPPHAQAPRPVARHSSPWMRIAAGLVLPLVLAGGWAFHQWTGAKPMPSSATALSTAPGERHDLALADGTHVALAGGTRFSVSSSGRDARLLNGRATFQVVHNASLPFSVSVGDIRLIDVGTVFDVRAWPGGTDVTVAQGKIQVEGAGPSIQLVAGQMAHIAAGHAPQISSIATDDVAGWQHRRFNYADARLEDIAADLSNALGADIRAAPRVKGQPFEGSIEIAGAVGPGLKAVSPLLGVTVRQEGSTWILDKPSDASSR